MGVSLIAPVALLVAAVVVAAGGGGLGGLGSLGQISSGPTLPDLGPVANTRASLQEAERATAGLAPATLAAPGAVDTGPAGGFAPSPGGRTQDPGRAPAGTITPGTGTPGSAPPATGRPPAVGVPPTSTPRPPAAPPADPVDEVIDTTRGLGDALPAPLKPPAGEIIDPLLGPKR